MSINVSIALDIFAFSLLIILMSSFFARRKQILYSQQLTNIYLVLFLFIFIDIIFLIVYKNYNQHLVLLERILYSIHMLLSSIFTVLWAQLVIDVVWANSAKKKPYTSLFSTSLIISFVLVIINFSAPLLFTINTNGLIRIKEPFYSIFYGLNIVVVVATYFTAIKNRYRVKSIILMPLLSSFCAPIIMSMAYLFKFYISVTCSYVIAGYGLYIASSSFEHSQDELTGLDNRTTIDHVLASIFNTNDSLYICGLLVDLEGMKQINETYGHEFGDKAIIRMSNILKLYKEKDINVIRYGGDEFLLVWKTDDENSITLIQHSIDNDIIEFNRSLVENEQLHFAIAGECRRIDEINADEFIKHLDIQLYHKKQESDRIIEDALQNNRFEVYYQPIIDLRTNQFTFAEALLRLVDSPYGYYNIGQLIEAAERSGQIIEIGTFVLETVCKFIQENDISQYGIKHISVNLSLSQYMSKKLVNDVLSIVNKYNFSHRLICFEILETNASCDLEPIRENLALLRDAGFYVALDDFGNGYSNMHRLLSIPFKYVKLDRSIVNHDDVVTSSVVIQQMCKLFHSLHCEIIAEGVENVETVNRLRQIGVDHIQGFYYSKAIPADDYIKFIAGHNAC